MGCTLGGFRPELRVGLIGHALRWWDICGLKQGLEPVIRAGLTVLVGVVRIQGSSPEHLLITDRVSAIDALSSVCLTLSELGSSVQHSRQRLICQTARDDLAPVDDLIQ